MTQILMRKVPQGDIHSARMILSDDEQLVWSLELVIARKPAANPVPRRFEQTGP